MRLGVVEWLSLLQLYFFSILTHPPLSFPFLIVFVDSRSFLEDRKIKLVAEDECGRHRFVCGFVSPSVRTPRSVDGPRFAARFVSLLPFKRDVSLSGERVSTWHSAQCTAVRLQGDVEDHALLLCSMLLGWGMDAWVCYGTIYDTTSAGAAADGGSSGRNSDNAHASYRPHYWVVTLDDLHDGRLVFWESLTGQQYNVHVDRHLKIAGSGLGSGGDEHPFREVFTLFRHDAFLLNTQRFSIVLVCPASIPLDCLSIPQWNK